MTQMTTVSRKGLTKSGLSAAVRLSRRAAFSRTRAPLTAAAPGAVEPHPAPPRASRRSEFVARGRDAVVSARCDDDLGGG